MTLSKFKSLRTKTGVTLLILLTLMTLQCSKTTDEPDPVTPAFPEKYCGNFTFTVINIYHNPSPSSDTTVYNGTISLLDKSTGKIEVRYLSGRNTMICNNDSIWGAYINPVVAESGLLDYPAANGCGATQPFSGGFSGTDTIAFNMTSGGNWYSEQRVKGVRIKK